MEDPDNRAPLVWQTIYPYPLSKAARGGRDARPARVARQLRAFERLAPEFRGLHPLDATSPQECSEITAHVFRSLRFDTTYRIPTLPALAGSATAICRPIGSTGAFSSTCSIRTAAVAGW